MHRYLLLAAIGLLIGSSWAAAADDAAEAKKLQGDWTVVAFEARDKKVPDEALKAMKIVFQDNGMTLFDGKKEERGTFKLFPDTKPKSMDLTMERGMRVEVALFIYELDGDNLKLCWRKPGNDRPTEFTAKDTSGLMILKRAKKE